MMANRNDPISAISPAKELWSIIVRVVRLWFVSDFNKQNIPFSMEMVLMDDKVLLCYYCFLFLLFFIYFKF